MAQVDDEIEIIVQEEDNTSSDLVGDVVLKMRKLIGSEPIQQWIEIKFDNKPAGKVHVRSTWTPFPPNSSRLQKAKSSAAEASGQPAEAFDYQPLLDAKDKEIEARESIIKDKDEEIESIMKLMEGLKN